MSDMQAFGSWRIILLEDESLGNPDDVLTRVGANGAEFKPGGGGGASAWGDITGTLANQTDLQAALDAVTFDQDLNTTDDVVFATLVLTGGSPQITGPADNNFRIISPNSITDSGRNLELLSGDSTVAGGGHLIFESGNSSVGAGGDVDLFAGDGVQGGEIEIEAGDGTTGPGGNIDIEAGDSSAGGNGGTLNLRAGSGATGGNVNIQAFGNMFMDAVDVYLTPTGSFNLNPTGAININGTPTVTEEVVIPGVGTLSLFKGLATGWAPV